MVWGEGYCTLACEREDNREDWRDCAPLYDPNDPTGAGVIAANRNEVEAMLEAGAIDPRLPKIIYLRKHRKTMRAIGLAVGIHHSTVTKILAKAPRNLLMECGLQQK